MIVKSKGTVVCIRTKRDCQCHKYWLLRDKVIFCVKYDEISDYKHNFSASAESHCRTANHVTMLLNPFETRCDRNRNLQGKTRG